MLIVAIHALHENSNSSNKLRRIKFTFAFSQVMEHSFKVQMEGKLSSSIILNIGKRDDICFFFSPGACTVKNTRGRGLDI